MTKAHFILTYAAPFLLINFGNACAYLFQVLLARTLSPADLGAFNAALSAATLLAAPAAVAPMAVTHLVNEAGGVTDVAAYRIVIGLTAKWALAAAAVAIASVSLLATPLLALLKISGAWQGINVALLFGFTLTYPFAAGWYQARGHYVVMSAILGGVPVLRLGLGLLLVLALGYGINGALLSASLPCIMAFAAGLIGLAHHGFWGTPAANPQLVREGLRFVLPSAASTVLIYALFNVDMIFARVLLPETQSGYYAVAATLGRIPFLVSAAVANSLYGEMKNQARQKADSRGRQLLQIVMAVAALALAFALPLAGFAEFIVVAVAGPAYLAAAPILRIACFAMAGLAVLNTVVVLGMTTTSKMPLAILSAGVAMFIVACVGFARGEGIALAPGAVIAAVLLACLPVVHRALRVQGLQAERPGNSAIA